MSHNVLFCIHLCEDDENVKKASSAIRLSDCEDNPSGCSAGYGSFKVLLCTAVHR